MLSLADLAFLALLCVCCYHIWQSQGVKERSKRAVENHLKTQQLQLLDDNIALRALWLKRNSQGQLSWWRRYHFEFSAQGDERYQGRIITLGNTIETIQLQAHRMPEDSLH